MAHDGRFTTNANVQAWEVSKPLLDAMYAEFKELSKKHPDGAVGKSKIGIINRLLTKCRQALSKEDSLAFLDLVDEENVPQNSDVVLTLSQYVAAMDQYHEAYYGWDGVEHSWATNDE